jgi:hypothetical protein
MDIRLQANESFRVKALEAFVDVSCVSYNAITVDFQRFQKQQLRSKEGTYRMFVFKKTYNIEDFDFGWFSDSQIVWQNF